MEIQTANSFLKKETFDDLSLLLQCISEVDNLLLKNPQIKIYDKIAYQHRSIGFFSNTSKGYKYSGQIAKSQKLTSSLEILLNKINDKFDAKYNGILVNKYCDGNDYIGAHSDDETALDKKSGVIAISCGASRKFRIRNKEDKKIVKDIILNDGDLVQMGGNFQKEFTHEIPIEKKVSGIRFSFTFRYHLE